MLVYNDIEYGVLLQRCAFGEIDAAGYRFNVGNYVVLFSNTWGDVRIAGVYVTSSELRKRLLELAKQFAAIEDADWDVYRIVPTCDDDA